MNIFLIYSSGTSLLLGPEKYPDWSGVLTGNGTEFIQKVSSSGCGYKFGYKYHHGNRQKNKKTTTTTNNTREISKERPERIIVQ